MGIQFSHVLQGFFLVSSYRIAPRGSLGLRDADLILFHFQSHMGRIVINRPVLFDIRYELSHRSAHFRLFF